MLKHQILCSIYWKKTGNSWIRTYITGNSWIRPYSDHLRRDGRNRPKIRKSDIGGGSGKRSNIFFCRKSSFYAWNIDVLPGNQVPDNAAISKPAYWITNYFMQWKNYIIQCLIGKVYFFFKLAAGLFFKVLQVFGKNKQPTSFCFSDNNCIKKLLMEIVKSCYQYVHEQKHNLVLYIFDAIFFSQKRILPCSWSETLAYTD